jgi:hypothetical protein
LADFVGYFLTNTCLYYILDDVLETYVLHRDIRLLGMSALWFIVGFASQLVFSDRPRALHAMAATALSVLVTSPAEADLFPFLALLLWDTPASVVGAWMGWGLLSLLPASSFSKAKHGDGGQEKEGDEHVAELTSILVDGAAIVEGGGLAARVAQELADSEQRYVSQLAEFRKHVLMPLQNSPSLPPQTVKEAFSSLEIILDYNRAFLAELKQNAPSTPAEVCAILLRFAPFFKIYGQYAAAQSTSLRALDKLRGRAEFVRMRDQGLAKCRFSNRLDSYLILPVQRIMRYPLLLREMRRAAAKDAKDAKASAKETEGAEGGTADDRTDEMIGQALAKVELISDKVNAQRERWETSEFKVCVRVCVFVCACPACLRVCDSPFPDGFL